MLTVIVLASRKETFMREVRKIDHSLSKPTPFPLTKESWPKNLEWQDGSDQKPFSDPRATKGGIWESQMGSFPPNFRQVGPESNSGFRGLMDDNDMGPIAIHPVTQEIMPALAKAWAVNKENTKIYFKLDPDATWDDGVPVTVDDFIFRLKAMRSPGIIAPWYNQYYSTMVKDILKFDDHRMAVVLPSPLADPIMSAAIRPLPYHFYGGLRKINKSYPASKALSYLKRDGKEIPS